LRLAVFISNKVKHVSSKVKPGIWRRSHYLDRMTLKELWVAYFQYPAIIGYLALTAPALWCGRAIRPPLPRPRRRSAVVLVLYPLVWYCLHRWVLHSNWMFKVPFLASTWKRIHYDHHQDPNHLEVLFGALHTTLPTIALVTFRSAMRSAASAAARRPSRPGSHDLRVRVRALHPAPRLQAQVQALAEMKKRHMAHHFHDERGNYGITSYFWDRRSAPSTTGPSARRRARRCSTSATPRKSRPAIRG
jgi:hypothetical protein